jgi:hypothetical protein
VGLWFSVSLLFLDFKSGQALVHFKILNSVFPELNYGLNLKDTLTLPNRLSVLRRQSVGATICSSALHYKLISVTVTHFSRTRYIIRGASVAATSQIRATGTLPVPTAGKQYQVVLATNGMISH